MTTAREILDGAISEDDWQEQVIEYAQLRGWLVAHFRPAMTAKGWRTPVSADGAGFPDLFMVRLGRCEVAELKTERGKVSAEQARWLDRMARAGLTVRLWRPSDWPDVERILR